MNSHANKQALKILFLDIDGVCNSRNTTSLQDLYPIDPYMAFMVGKIQLDTNCEVVLSSSWRHHPDGVAAVEKSIVKVFDKTPTVKWDGAKRFARGREWPHEIRGDEINAWLAIHPNVNRYAILDDDSDFYDDQPLFQTSFDNGLTEDIMHSVIEHLSREQ